ncbi:MAG: ABC transporter ATP-binding protein [Armatimonadota bacterium]|nr:ABC transporter ATP-binding protein [bacterium]
MKVISVENVSKKFVLAGDRPKNLADAARGIFRRPKRQDFWALKDVNFDVEQGEAIGVIGHNGAGKSTMLKLLTRIMQPTSGHIRTRGRVSALIEVGAGFHPEMTGRENIYLNGSILGMTRREIDQKFDEIVAFAELERFIDTPVKRYSSGMYARLGFAVAAHVDPEILIVDEVLSVGDAAFQEKCSQRMQELRDSEKTIVFVSHNMGAVSSLCDRVVVINRGQIHSISAPQEAVKTYGELLILERDRSRKIAGDSSAAARPGVPMHITGLDILNDTGEWLIRSGDPLKLRINYSVSDKVMAPRLGVQILDEVGRIIVHSSNLQNACLSDIAQPGYCEVEINTVPIVPGRYRVCIKAADAYGTMVYDDGVISNDLAILPPSQTAGSGAPRFGHVWVDSSWSYHTSGACEDDDAR